MACSTETSSKIAEQAIGAMAGQIDLMYGLAVAIVGGVIALMLQVAIHNKSMPAARVSIASLGVLNCGIILQVLSLILGILAKGSLTSSIPSILSTDFCGVEHLKNVAFAGSIQLSLLAASQSFGSLIGIVCIAWVAWANRSFVK